jgi:2,4-dichlorophenol 6-monooxygenase
LSEIDEGGCLLVRPDGHIAWRCAEPVDGQGTALREALSRVLHR